MDNTFDEPICPKCYQQNGLIYQTLFPYLLCGECGWEAVKAKTPLDWFSTIIKLWGWSVAHNG